MKQNNTPYVNTPYVFVVGNEKGGAGKTTCSMHLIIGLLDRGYNIASIDTDNERRDNHLKTADFFDAEKFPTLNFTSTSFKKVEGKKYKMIGNLTMHGVTKEIITGGSIEIKDGNMYVNSEFKVSPEDYDIEIPSVVREKIANEILVTIKAKLAPL